MKLGTKLTIYLSLIIMVVLIGYGYFHILSRRDILITKMKVEVRSTGRTLKVSLEKISLPREMEYVQDLIDAVEDYERTLGAIVYHQEKNLVFRSRSIKERIEPYLEMIKKSIREDLHQEEFGVYDRSPVFSYVFPLKDRKGRNIGGVSLLQHTSFMEEDITRAKWSIFITLFILIGGTVILILFTTRRWISHPISKLMAGIKELARGNLHSQIDLRGKDELSALAQAFNQMAMDLNEAQKKIIQEAENKLELERGLRHSERLATLGQLVSGLAHEIGTPLNIIGGRAEFIKRKLDDREGAEKNLNIIIHQTERITKIIQQLLGFVRKKKPGHTTLVITPLLETTLDFLEHEIQRHKVKVIKELENDLPSVMGDPEQLQQVFSNLILNAIQSMPAGGELRLSTSSKRLSKQGLEDHQHLYVEVCVQDTGVGMAREVLENIFHPFFTTKDAGTGLGLMVTQGIIQDHEGWIEVNSKVGEGSTFQVYLPAYEGER
ncbi:MAG: HAMP domain-containing protein [Deltaproteobacteria bacterium]|nr:HAMP domain-containing protein [Deltaproteobacteria bacterium]